MSRVERISDRFPRFYKSWEKESVISILIKSISEQLNKAEEGITDLMKAHWVDTASDAELDKLGSLVGSRRMPDEDGDHLRGRLKRAVDEYKGGGTVSVIREQVRELTGAKSGEDIEVIENPLAEASAEFAVIANDTWTLGSNSIEDENPNLYLTVEGKGEVSNPQITNMDTSQSITFKGKLKTGQQLIMKQNIALLGEEDVTGNVSPQEPPRLLRRGSSWKYSESLSERIGVFDTGKFDEHTFAVGVPTVKVRFEWTRRQPATFTIQVKSRTLRDSGLAEPYLEKAASSMKAAGVNAIIKVME